MCLNQNFGIIMWLQYMSPCSFKLPYLMKFKYKEVL